MSDDPSVALFHRVREVVEGDASLTLDEVGDRAQVPTQELREVFAAMDWDGRPGYDDGHDRSRRPSRARPRASCCR